MDKTTLDAWSDELCKLAGGTHVLDLRPNAWELSRILKSNKAVDVDRLLDL